MDTVLFIFINNRAYVGDFYKGELKKVIFKELDYWEIYGKDDLENLLEYLNYPLGYNRFKGSEVKILIDKPLTYNYLYELKDYFRQAEAINIGKVMPFFFKYLEINREKIEGKVDFANRFYAISYEAEIQLIEEEEDIEQVYHKVDELGLYRLMMSIDSFFEDTYKGKSEEVLKRYIVLSPTIIYNEIDKNQKGYYLKVDNELIREGIVREGQQVKKGEELFRYTHTVQKLWGRKKIETLSKKSLKDGTFFWCYTEKEGQLWAGKNEVVGIITKEKCKDDALQWLEYIMQ